MKRIFGVQEKQFVRYFKEAARVAGRTPETLLTLLERRLDNVVYRLGFARTRPMARQLVTHGHVLVDGKKVDIPSYRVSQGQTISLSETAASIPSVQERMEETKNLIPAWLERLDTTGRVVRMPTLEEMERRLDLGLIVEYYSR
jgi:small subunit ribosomal protein S4